MLFVVILVLARLRVMFAAGKKSNAGKVIWRFMVKMSKEVHVLPPMLKMQEKYTAFLKKRAETTSCSAIAGDKFDKKAPDALSSFHGGEWLFTKDMIKKELHGWRRSNSSKWSSTIPDNILVESALDKPDLSQMLSTVRSFEFAQPSHNGKQKQKNVKVKVEPGSNKGTSSVTRRTRPFFRLQDTDVLQEAKRFLVSELLGGAAANTPAASIAYGCVASESDSDSDSDSDDDDGNKNYKLG